MCNVATNTTTYSRNTVASLMTHYFYSALCLNVYMPLNCDQQSAVMLQLSPYHTYKETDHDSLCISHFHKQNTSYLSHR